MAIDININNQNKHWLLVILGKIKDFILAVWSFVVYALAFTPSAVNTSKLFTPFSCSNILCSKK